MKTIFSTKLVNTKVVENFIIFPQSIVIQESEFLCGIYDQNIELDKEKTK
jgi:hypothetical protein